MRILYKTLLAALWLVILLPTSRLQAAIITIGTQSPGNLGENCIPFGCPNLFGISTYQQLYASGAFFGPINIETITFFDTNPGDTVDTNAVTSGNYTFSFSTTTRSLGDLEFADLGNNIGSGSQIFFDGALSGALPGDELTIIGISPFPYDPSLGNLLLTIGLTGLATDSFSFYDLEGFSATVFSRVWNGTTPESLAGLVTRFEVSPIPLPAALPLFLSALAGLGLMGWRRKQGGGA